MSDQPRILAALTVARWWLRRVGRWVRRFGPLTAAYAAVVGLLAWREAWTTVTATVTPVVLSAAVLTVWRVRWPGSFAAYPGRFAGWWGWRRWWRRSWPDVAEHCRLADRKPATTPGEPAIRLVPAVERVGLRGPVLTVRLRLLVGQVVEDVERAAPAIRTALSAMGLRVEPDPRRPSVVELRFVLADLLTVPFDAVLPPAPVPGRVSGAPDRVWMGKGEDGREWWLPVGPHLLVAGATGSGKASILWSLLFGLAPAIGSGTVRVHGIDLKGGVELLIGARLCTRIATTHAQAVAVLTDLVHVMDRRLNEMAAGGVRVHAATVAEPLHVLLVDEFGDLIAYCPDRTLAREAERLMNLLQTKGRAPGVWVVAAVQDPAKDVVPQRDLFPQRIGLRLASVSQTSMVLGDAAVDRGAACHRITRTLPGVGYVQPEDGGPPVRVRAGYASDEAIRTVAAVFAAPVKESITVPQPLEPEVPSPRPMDGERSSARSSGRSPRKPRAPRAPRATTTASTAERDGDAA